ncbi:MAG: membrane protease YdiL (CAAX protease family) [Myxococcota bacterium]|jgi:membrane protease YdiL (CAAX protease family)
MDDSTPEPELASTAQASSSLRMPRSPFTPLASAIYASLWVLVMMHGWGDRIGSEPTSWLQKPVESAERIINRNLEMAEAGGRAGRGRAFHEALYGAFDETLEGALEISFDASDLVTSPSYYEYASGDGSAQRLRAETIRSVLLAESGDSQGARDVASELSNPAVTRAILSIYGLDEPIPVAPSPNALEHLAEAGIEDWLLERAAVRLLKQHGDDAAAASITNQTADRGSQWLLGYDLLTATNFALMAAGLLIAIGVAKGRMLASPATPLHVPWRADTGFGVLVRADFWNRFYFILLGPIGAASDFPQWFFLLYTWGNLIASLPLLWLVYRYLLLPSPRLNLTTFGFCREAMGLRWLGFAFLAALSIDLLGTTAISWGAWAFGSVGHWAEGIDETLIWGSTQEVIASCIDYVVWAPVFEELSFRGLLYLTLRRKFGALTAASLSAGIFSGLHFYTLPGFLMTFWSGFVWALVLERTRSLLPGILAHAAYNLFFVLGIVLVYR